MTTDPAILWKYLGVFLALVAAGFGFPIPEEIPIITAGGLVAGSPELKWWIMIPVCIVGVVLADTVLYTIGRFGGRRLMKNAWVQRRLITPEKRERIERNFHEYGIGILMVARLLPGIRTPIFIMAALPIGVAGFGAREAAAVAVLGYAGVAPDQAFAVGLLYGLAAVVQGILAAPLFLAKA